METLEKVELLPHCHGIRAFSIARGAYTPEAIYSGFNACHYVGDSTAHVAACRCDVAAELGIAPERLIIPRQTHSAQVSIVYDNSGSLEGVDALVTDKENLALCINTADCIPIILADPVKRIIGAVHSGWRGTISSIAPLTLKTMESLGAHPADVCAALGPSICRDCYEVGTDVADKFLKKYGAESGVVTLYGERSHVDLARAVFISLTEAGVNPQNISLPPECSYHSNGRWPSARKLQIDSPRTLTVVMLTSAESLAEKHQ